jgi:hypothetical protein
MKLQVSLTRRRVCRLRLLLGLASAVIFVSESRGTHDHILLSQIRDFHFRCLLRLTGLRWRYSTLPRLLELTNPLRVYLPGGWGRNHRLEGFRYCCLSTRCQGNLVLVSKQRSRFYVYTTLYSYLGNDSFDAICCSGNVISKPLFSNGRLALAPVFRLSAVTSQYIYIYIYIYKRRRCRYHQKNIRGLNLAVVKPTTVQVTKLPL